MAAKGIDVSTFQGEIDWQAVKRSGVSFAMIKATQGRAVSSDAYLFTDSRFVRNITQASQSGIECGVYHYLTARTVSEAVKEAEYFTRTILPYKPQIKLWAAQFRRLPVLKGGLLCVTSPKKLLRQREERKHRLCSKTER